MNKKPKKKQLIRKIQEPQLIHKTLKEGTEITISVGKYMLYWEAITNIPLSTSIVVKIAKVKKMFPDAHIGLTSMQDNPAFIFTASGKTIRHKEDIPNKSIGVKVARAKAFRKACIIGKAIALAVKEGLEEKVNSSIEILTVRIEKETRIIKEV